MNTQDQECVGLRQSDSEGGTVWRENKRNKTGGFEVHGGIAVKMDRKKCGSLFPFRCLSPAIYHINILRKPNEVDVHWGRSAKPK